MPAGEIGVLPHSNGRFLEGPSAAVAYVVVRSNGEKLLSKMRKSRSDNRIVRASKACLLFGIINCKIKSTYRKILLH